MGLLESSFASGVMLDGPEPDLSRWDEDGLIPAFTRERPAPRDGAGQPGRADAPPPPRLPIVDCPGCGSPTLAATYDSRTQIFTPAPPRCHACRAAED